MRLIDADQLIDNLNKIEADLFKHEDTFDKVFTLPMIQFAREIVTRFAERNEKHVDSG